MNRLLATVALLSGVWILVRSLVLQIIRIADNLDAYEEEGLYYYEATRESSVSVEQAWAGWEQFLETMADGSIKTLAPPFEITPVAGRPMLSRGTRIQVHGTVMGYNAAPMILRMDEVNYGQNVRLEVLPRGLDNLQFGVVEARIEPQSSGGVQLRYRQGFYQSPLGYAGKYLSYMREMNETVVIVERWASLCRALAAPEGSS